MTHSLLQYLLELLIRLGDWSYLIIFAAALLECAAFAGLIVPGESLVLASWQVAEKWISRSGLVLAGVLLLGILSLWLRRRRTRRPAATPQTS